MGLNREENVGIGNMMPRMSCERLPAARKSDNGEAAEAVAAAAFGTAFGTAWPVC